MEILLKYKKFFGALALTIGFIILIAIVITQSQSCLTKRSIDGALSNINVAQQDAENINTQIEELKDKQIEAHANINAAVKDLEEIQNEVNKAEENSNEALNTVNSVNGRDFNGTSSDAANAARCRAFPDSPECRLPR